MSAKYWLLGLAFVLVTGCTAPSKAKLTGTSVNSVSESQLEQESSEAVRVTTLTNISYTIRDLHQGKIQDSVTRQIIEEAVTRLKKQQIFYDTVEYIFEIESQESGNHWLIRVKEQYSDGAIERLCYTIDPATFTD